MKKPLHLFASFTIMNKSLITKEITEMISRGYQKAEIFAELLQFFGAKYQNLITQIMLFDYGLLREQYSPENAIKKDIIQLLKTTRNKGELYEHLYRKYGQKNNDLIIYVLEKDYSDLKRYYTVNKSTKEQTHKMDYTLFFNLNEKLKITTKNRHNYHLVKEFKSNDRILTGEIEIKSGKLFICVTSYSDNTLSTVFNFITVLNAVFKPHFVLALSDLLSVELKQREEIDSFSGLTPMVNKKITIQEGNEFQKNVKKFKQYLLNIFFTIDSEMATMTIIGEHYRKVQ